MAQLVRGKDVTAAATTEAVASVIASRNRCTPSRTSFVDSFKTELIRDRVWRTRTQLELAIVEYVAWFNTERLHTSLGDIPPSEYEEAYARR